MDKIQLLGLAFAGADLVFEIDDDGKIALILGASEHLTGLTIDQLRGKHWSELAVATDADMLSTMLHGLKPGERMGPFRLGLRPRPDQRLSRHASLSVFRLPQPGAKISCALSMGAPASLDDVPRTEEGLLEREAFSTAVGNILADAERAGLPVRLDLIEMDGLRAATAGMDPETADLTRRRIAATLRAESFGGVGGTEVAQDRFALVRSGEASTERLTERLQEAAGPGVRAITTELPFEATAAQNLKTMRYALDRYIEDGPKAAAQTFQATIEKTVRDSGRFRSLLATGAFDLAYQPVVEFKTGGLHHFEALARFDPNASPGDTIRLAEELGLIVDFDLAVAKTIAKVLTGSDPSTKIAANVSAVSLMRPSFVDALIAVTAYDAKLRPRLLLEITETQHLGDLPEANRVLARLRGLGHVVCLDDFGAGAASLDYLRHLEVDIVKIDGRYVQALDSNPKDSILLKHLVALCRELRVLTIAEMVETAETARLAKELGLDFGQGWHFSKPLPEPKWRPPASSPPPSRRKGSVETWG